MTALRDALARKDISKTDKYLVIVAYHDGPVKNAQIKLIAKENGWKDGAASRPELFFKQKLAHHSIAGWLDTERARPRIARGSEAHFEDWRAYAYH